MSKDSLEEAGKSFLDENSREFCEFQPKVDRTKTSATRKRTTSFLRRKPLESRGTILATEFAHHLSGRKVKWELRGAELYSTYQHSGCIFCGKSADIVHEEITFYYLERTHRAEKSCTTRQRRKDSFQSGMRGGSFFLVPREVSQAAACDENLYQVMANDRGVLPLLATWTASPR